MIKGRGIIGSVVRMLRDRRVPIWRYVLRAWLLALIPSIALGVVANTVAPDAGPGQDFAKMPPGAFIFGVLMFSPWLETLMMWPILGLLRLWLKRPVHLALGSALTWGVLHSLAAPVWGFVIFWPFFVFSLSFIAWRKKSLGHAIAVTALIHMCQNLLPALAFLAVR